MEDVSYSGRAAALVGALADDVATKRCAMEVEEIINEATAEAQARIAMLLVEFINTELPVVAVHRSAEFVIQSGDTHRDSPLWEWASELAGDIIGPELGGTVGGE